MVARPLLLIVALMAPLSSFAVTVYKSVDADGNVSYSDTPPADGRSAESIQITEYATGLSAEDMIRLQSMRETTDRMRDDRLAREEQRAQEQAYLPAALPDYAPGDESQTSDTRYLLPVYYPRHPRWRPPYVPPERTSGLIPNPDSLSPRGLQERLRQAR